MSYKKYYNYLDIPNWKKHQADLINFRNNNPPPDELIKEYAKMTPQGQEVHVSWYCFFEDTIEKELPELYATFKSMGLDVHQLIYFVNAPNKIEVKDPLDKDCIFIHIDAKDDEDWEETQFEPTNAINIPLENCENSETLFYKINDETPKYCYYPNFYFCGGVDPNSVTEVARLVLDKPAVLRVNVPHGVYNPTTEMRNVATFRFYNSTEFLFEDK
jgi:hypothetical protein